MVTQKISAAPKRLMLTQCNSAISFMKHVGSKSTEIKRPYGIFDCNHTGSSSRPPAKLAITDNAVWLHTFINIASRKNEFTQTIKHIKKMAGLPSVKYPISKSDDGLFGHASRALRYRAEHATT